MFAGVEGLHRAEFVQPRTLVFLDDAPANRQRGQEYRAATISIRAIGRVLGRVRAHSGMSQRRVARESGVSQAALSLYEAGHIRPGFLAAASIYACCVEQGSLYLAMGNHKPVLASVEGFPTNVGRLFYLERVVADRAQRSFNCASQNDISRMENGEIPPYPHTLAARFNELGVMVRFCITQPLSGVL